MDGMQLMASNHITYGWLLPTRLNSCQLLRLIDLRTINLINPCVLPAHWPDTNLLAILLKCPTCWDAKTKPDTP